VVTVPFPSASVFHPDWAAHAATVSEATMNATVTIRHGSGSDDDWDPTTGPGAGTDGTVTYTGPARITYDVVRGYGERDAAGQDVTTRVVTVALPRSAPEQVADARITVDTVTGNGLAPLTGRVLTVDSTGWSSHAIEQLLTCRDDQSNQPGEA